MHRAIERIGNGLERVGMFEDRVFKHGITGLVLAFTTLRHPARTVEDIKVDGASGVYRMTYCSLWKPIK